MKDKTKNFIITISFSAILIITFFVNVLMEDKTVSISERRKLVQLSDININNSDMMEKCDKYTSDQFVGRDFFRKVKSFVSINFFRQKDDNNLFEKDGSIYKMEYPLNEINLERTLTKINKIYDKYLKGMNVYYSIIPDKNHYLENDDHLKIDYEKMVDISKNILNNITYINIEKDLKLDDYYKTDLHWKQENLSKVVSQIQKSMNVLDTSQNEYEINNVGNFYGAYYGQLGIQVEPDTLYTLSNKVIDESVVYNYETQKEEKIYTNSKTADKYDTYLSGAVSLITIENPNSMAEKELLLFRDSYGSSIAPLLIENYKKITLIDLRYLSSEALDKYINFDNQDVLFLYGMLVLNQNLLKVF